MRQQGRAILGYYPTPPRVMEHILTWLAKPQNDQPFTAFDPTCGTGAALAQLQAPYSYGVELDHSRYLEATRTLSSALHGDFQWAAATPPHTMSVALVNPPYDYDAATGLRTELSTLQRLTPWLISHGVLILIIQDRQLPTVWSFIATHYHVQHIFRFPDPEWAQFEQIVLLASNDPHLSATIRTRQERDDYARSFPQPRLRSQASWELPSFPLLTPRPLESPALIIPPATPPVSFQLNPVRPDTVYRALATQNLYATARRMTELHTLPQDAVYTPTTLHRGHLATLLTAGRLTGAIGTGTARHLVKGRVITETVETQREVQQDGTLLIKTETRHRVELRTLHPDGTVQVWGRAPADSNDPALHSQDSEALS
ncbi:MAG: DUF6094 domain-containing protein [Sulfobacillus sp.]